jgi:hypothetical protein
MTIFNQWLNDPVASSALTIALVAGTWAVAQFRPLARERRRETYEAMTTHYVELRAARDAAVPHFPPLVAVGQRELQRVLSSGDCNSDHVARQTELASALKRWMRHDIAFTAAHEVIDSEVKFRVFLWTIETIRQWRQTTVLILDGQQCSVDVLNAATDLAHDLNAFLFHYENGNYPARQTLGLLHRSLAVVAKATEPVVWERSLDARWGRRVLRIGLASQHFNDVTPIHSISDLTWKPNEGTRRLIHPRARRSVLGVSAVVLDSPLSPRLLPGLRLRVRSAYWYLVGVVSPAPKLWFAAYGGLRLRRHRRRENPLAGLLKLACDRKRGALDLSWSLHSLKQEQRDAAHAERRRHGRLAWLWSGWQPSPEQDSARTLD